MMQKVLDFAFMQPAREIDLINAAKKNQVAELQAKIHLTQVNINSTVDQCGITATHWAAIYASDEFGSSTYEALRLLLQYGGDTSKANNGGTTPMDSALRRGNAEAVELLKAANRANGLNEWGGTELNY